MEQDIEIQRKRLIFRSLHRGTKEMDHLLGKFAENKIPIMGDAELDNYEIFLEEADPDLYNWITKKHPVPEEKQTQILKEITEFHGF